MSPSPRTPLSGTARRLYILGFVTSAAFHVNAFLSLSARPLSNKAFLTTRKSTALSMSFFSDGSDYKPSDSDYSEEDVHEKSAPGKRRDDDESPVVDHTPVPMSKNNNGNRFVAFIFDRALRGPDADVVDLHEARIELTEDHVLFCRKANLYNETFNQDSMADVVWSHQILSSDLVRTIGHAMCIDATTIEHVYDLLSRDPIVQSLTGGDTSNIPLYRWRHIRDHTLRQDDGRQGAPTLLLALDRTAEEGVGNLREEVTNDHLEYLIRSERVIAAGPLHLPTELKNDPSSFAVGDMILFNAEDRTEAVEFAENDPAAKKGLYHSIRVHRYNALDVTGKFVSDNLYFPDLPCTKMKEAMEYWGYPVDDEQTQWLNW